MALTCELCGSTDLVKQDGVFVCQACGAKYSVEAAKEMMGAPAEAPKKPQVSSRIEEIKARARAAAEEAKRLAHQVPKVEEGADFDPKLIAALADSSLVNNYVCQGFSAYMDEYAKIEHPSEKDLDAMVVHAKDCLSYLQAAALKDPSDHLANLLIYKNCEEIVRATCDLPYWEKDEEGEWKKRSFGASRSDLKIAGQKDSWADLARDHQDYVEMAWVEANEDKMAERRELAEKAEGVRARLDELKEEKKSLGIGANIPILSGLFNSDTQEMNERMKPVREELKGIESQIAAIDREKSKWLEEQLDELGKSFIRLDF